MSSASTVRAASRAEVYLLAGFILYDEERCALHTQAGTELYSRTLGIVLMSPDDLVDLLPETA